MPRIAQNTPRVGLTHEKRSNGDVYVYERTTLYKPELGYAVVLKRTLLGKIPAGESEMVPTRPRKRPLCTSPPRATANDQEVGADPDSTNKKPSAIQADDVIVKAGEDSRASLIQVPLTASRLHVGMLDIFNALGKRSGIEEALRQAVCDEGIADKILSIAYYWLATGGSTLPTIETWQLNHKMPYREGITENIYHDLFEAVGLNESIQQNYFRIRFNSLGAKHLIAIDSTTQSTDSTKLGDARRGYNKDHDGKNTIKLLLLYDIDSRQPIAFTKQPGNISDMSAIENSVKELVVLSNCSIQDIELVFDNGFASEKNMGNLIDSGFDFITLVKTSLKWIRPIIVENELKMKISPVPCPFDANISCLTVPVKKTFTFTKQIVDDDGAYRLVKRRVTKEVFVHVYFNLASYTEQRKELYDDLVEIQSILLSDKNASCLSKEQSAKAKKYLDITKDSKGLITSVEINIDKFNEGVKYFGFFVLVANAESNPFKALRKYRKRETIENVFKVDKQQVDASRPRVQGDPTLRGRMFVQFITLCYHEYYSTLIRNMQETLGKRTSDKKHDTKKNLDDEKNLLDWITKKSLCYQLQWFDVYEEVTINGPVVKERFTTENTKRDRLYLKMLGVDSPPMDIQI